MNSNVTDISVTSRLFERIVQSPQNLLAIETNAAEELLAQFRTLAMRSGQSVYAWQADIGLTSLRERDLLVPGTRRVADTLRYILQSMQFGIYLFTDFDEHMRPPNTGLLRNIARIRSGNGRKVVFVAEKIKFPDGFDDLVDRMGHSAASVARPRLRDGRWVI